MNTTIVHNISLCDSFRSSTYIDKLGYFHAFHYYFLSRETPAFQPLPFLHLLHLLHSHPSSDQVNASDWKYLALLPNATGIWMATGVIQATGENQAIVVEKQECGNKKKKEEEEVERDYPECAERRQ